MPCLTYVLSFVLRYRVASRSPAIRELLITFVTLADTSHVEDTHESDFMYILRTLRSFLESGAPKLTALPLPIQDCGLERLPESCEAILDLDWNIIYSPPYLDV